MTVPDDNPLERGSLKLLPSAADAVIEGMESAPRISDLIFLATVYDTYVLGLWDPGSEVRASGWRVFMCDGAYDDKWFKGWLKYSPLRLNHAAAAEDHQDRA